MRSWPLPCRLPITARLHHGGSSRSKARREPNFGEVFVDALKKRDPDADGAAIEKERNRPMRSPMIVVAVAKIDDTVANVPPIEQAVATGIAAYNMIVAAQAKGFGGILLTGKNAQPIKQVSEREGGARSRQNR